MKLSSYDTKQLLSHFGVQIRAEVPLSDRDAHSIVKTLHEHNIKDYVIISADDDAITLRVDHPQTEALLTAFLEQHDTSSLTTRSLTAEPWQPSQINLSAQIRTDYITGKLMLQVTHWSNQAMQAHKQINVFLGVREYQMRDIASDINLPREYWRTFANIMQKLLECYIASDAALLRLDSLTADAQGEFTVLQAQMTIDDYALYRQGHLLGQLANNHMPENQTHTMANNIFHTHRSAPISIITNDAGMCLKLMDGINILRYGDSVLPANTLEIGNHYDADTLTTAVFTATRSDNTLTLLHLFCSVPTAEETTQYLLNWLYENALENPMVVHLAGIGAAGSLRLLEEKIIPNLIIKHYPVEAAQYTADWVNQP